MDGHLTSPETPIVLVRHARPAIDPVRPAGDWLLADDANESVLRLAEGIGAVGADGIVTSPEPKALGTARLIAGRLDLPVMVDEALREQGGDMIPWIAGPEEFRAAVREHFGRADEAVLGDEPSADAAARFAEAVERARGQFRCPVVVTHGRVMCGYLGASFGIDPMEIWETLRLPDAFVLDLVSGSVVRIQGKEG